MQWPRMSVCGLSMAASIRSVMAGDSMRSLECTLATTTSSSASRSSSWSSEPSSRMSTSMPVRMRKGARSSFSSASTSSWARSRSALRPWATVRRALWSVSTRYSCPRSAGRLGHLADGAPAVGPVGVGVAVAAQRAQELLGRRVELEVVVGRLLQLAQALGHLAVEGLGDDLRGRLADAVDGLQPPGLGQRARACRRRRPPRPGPRGERRAPCRCRRRCARAGRRCG